MKNMFNHDSFVSQDTISLLLSFGQSMKFRFLERRLTVLMKFCQTLVIRVHQDAKMFGEIATIIPEQLKIVFASKLKVAATT